MQRGEWFQAQASLVERMNRTIKEATVKRVKTLTPYEYNCKIRTTEPKRFKLTRSIKYRD